MVSGTTKIDSYSGKVTFDKPQYSIMSGDFLEADSPSNLNLGRIVPIYPLSENLNIKTLRKAIFNAITIYKPKIKTIIPNFIREKYGIMEKSDAIEQIHFPTTMENLEHARFSLVFEELFLIQLKLARLRVQNRKNNISIPLKVKENGLVKTFINNLPFELTSAQRNAVNDILNL